MRLRYLNADDLELALPMVEAAEAMKAAFGALSAGRAVAPPRGVLELPDRRGTVLLMGAELPGAGISAKVVSVFHDNAARGLGVVNGIAILLDPETGEPRAVCNGAALTAVRTGAASAAATDLLASPHGRSCGPRCGGRRARAANGPVRGSRTGGRAMRTSFRPGRARWRFDRETAEGWSRIRTIDAHTAGEPLRVIVDGFPDPPGATVLAKRRFARDHCDGLRRALMWEPRGHADMYGCLLTPPATDDGDVGVLFLHNEGFSTMCGHGIIGLVKVGLDCGLLTSDEDEPVVRIDTPAGRVTATARRHDDGSVDTVSFLNVPSFLLERDVLVQVDGIGRVTCDIAFGGAFYAYTDAGPLDLRLNPGAHAQIIDVGMRIKRAVIDQYAIVHPAGDDDLNFLYGTVFVQRLRGAVHSRNVCVFAEGEVDRSPTGTGVSGRAAIHHARGELVLGETLTIESILGTAFDVRVHEETRVGDLPAIVPQVTGRAHVTGHHEFLIDPDDELRGGFILR
jgi:trans-L-3-hydroxyproline dehydratase